MVVWKRVLLTHPGLQRPHRRPSLLSAQESMAAQGACLQQYRLGHCTKEAVGSPEAIDSGSVAPQNPTSATTSPRTEAQLPPYGPVPPVSKATHPQWHRAHGWALLECWAEHNEK